MTDSHAENSGIAPFRRDFETVRKQTVVSEVMKRIRDLIAAGNYGPGDRIPTELELSRRFGVGRSTVREAIKVFEHLGVLEAKAAKGTFVRDRAHISAEAISWAALLGNDDLRDVVQLREVIEKACFQNMVRSFAQGEAAATRAVDRLQELVEEIRRAAEANEAEAVAEGDYAFHGTIIGMSGNRLFAEVYETLHSFMRLEIRKSYQAVPALSDVARDHAEMVHALRTLPPAEAIARHAAHFDRIRGLLSVD